MKKADCLAKRDEALRAADYWALHDNIENAEKANAAANAWLALADMHWKTRENCMAQYEDVIAYPQPDTVEPVSFAGATSEMPIAYAVSTSQGDVVGNALRYIESLGVVRYANGQINSPDSVRDYLRLKLHDQRIEQFWAIYVDTQNRIIDIVKHADGTISSCHVYPREIVRQALLLDASCVVLAHNHPSWTCEPSHADILLTKKIKAALELIDCRMLDHFIVAGGRYYSFAESGEL